MILIFLCLTSQKYYFKLPICMRCDVLFTVVSHVCINQACLPYLKETGKHDGAVIINVTAFLQDFATPFQAHAASAKAGIDVMTNQMGVEWGEYVGIQNISCPVPLSILHFSFE